MTIEEKAKLDELLAKQKAEQQTQEKPVKPSELDSKLENAKKELELKKIEKEMADLDKPQEPKKKPNNKYEFIVNGDDSVKASQEDWDIVNKLL